MEKHWGKNPEYAIYVYHNFNIWGGRIAFPFVLSWWNCKMADGWNFSIDLCFLCFGFEFEIWRWKK